MSNATEGFRCLKSLFKLEESQPGAAMIALRYKMAFLVLRKLVEEGATTEETVWGWMPVVLMGLEKNSDWTLTAAAIKAGIERGETPEAIRVVI